MIKLVLFVIKCSKFYSIIYLLRFQILIFILILQWYHLLLQKRLFISEFMSMCILV
jgi:hypothetical protein